MEAIGSEVGQKMRSAIKAKLMELGCYVDDELPDYVMVMVANKRTRAQMEDDLQLFLTNNTEAFVGWLHQVLQKLQEVTINKKMLSTEDKKPKSKSADVKKERKEKKKDKLKSKNKEKSISKEKHSKKDKNKGKKKHSSVGEEEESIRPNVPPIYMNLAKESSPSITDVFAGQILKSHGIKLSSLKKGIESGFREKKKLNRNKFPIIDPNSVSQISEAEPSTSVLSNVEHFDVPTLTEVQLEHDKLAALPREEQIKEYNEINEKIQTLKKKLTEQLESGSEDEDFINLRTEAEELIGVDLCEELGPIIKTRSGLNTNLSSSSNLIPLDKPAALPVSPPEAVVVPRTPSPALADETVPIRKARTPIRAPSPDKPPELPGIELNLPKRPMRERLGVKQSSYEESVPSRNANESNPTRTSNDLGHDRMHSDKHSRHQNERNIKIKINRDSERARKVSETSEEFTSKRRIGSRVVPLPQVMEDDGGLGNLSVPSVVRAPPRPVGTTGAPASQLLLRAMADAHKSLLTMPPKSNEPKKKATVLPMRRNADHNMKIIIQVPSENIPMSNSRNDREDSGDEIDMDTESLGELESDGDNNKFKSLHDAEYVPEPLKKPISIRNRVDYVPSHIHNSDVEIPVISRVLHLKNEKTNPVRKDTQFVVTLEGVNPNMFLEKKLCKEIEDEKNQSNQKTEVVREEEDDKMPEEKKDTTSNVVSCSTENSQSNTENKKDVQTKSPSKSCNSSDKRNITERTVPAKNNCKETEESSISKEDKSNSARNEKLERVSSSSDVNEPCRKEPNVTKTSKRKSEGNEEKPTKQKRSVSPIVFDKVESTRMSSKYRVIPPLSVKVSTSKTRCKFYPDCALGPACEFYHPPLTPSPTAGCRSFPNCPFGDKCVYGHPLCKFDVLCTRTGCPYAHGGQNKTNKLVISSSISPAIASRVVPVQNFKTISANPLPALCKFYPQCTNPGCHFFHPKPCRFGKACLNKIECNFYHHDLPTTVKYYS